MKNTWGKKLLTLFLTVLAVVSFSGTNIANAQTASQTDILTKIKDLEFSFSSGTGGWSTEVRIFPDGTFSGFHHDNNLGETGPGYPNGTRYECDFSGKFDKPVKISNYEYRMKCKSLTQKGKKGGKKIVNGVQVIVSGPYGFDDADEFIIYLPGKKVAELPEQFRDWVRYSINGADKLTFYGLYNVKGEMGFSSYPRKK